MLKRRTNIQFLKPPSSRNDAAISEQIFFLPETHFEICGIQVIESGLLETTLVAIGLVDAIDEDKNCQTWCDVAFGVQSNTEWSGLTWDSHVGFYRFVGVFGIVFAKSSIALSQLNGA